MIAKIWRKASEVADLTPGNRNRYIDFLRAASILFVVFGHWLMAAVVYDANTEQIMPVNTLAEVPWTQWLTWLFQVMPVFFFVGGFSNALSLDSAKQKNLSYGQWFSGRLHRLLTPLLFLLFCWAGISVVMNLLAVPPEKIALVSQMALVPTWFLSIYALICMLAPLSYAFWQRLGWLSFLIYVALAVLTDIAFFASGIEAIGVLNYFWVWLAVHHLGFAWYQGRVAGAGGMLLLAAAGFTVLAALVFFGPYPLAMAGSPANEVSNSLPPKVTLIALGLGQFGLIVALQKPMQKLLTRAWLWTSTVLISSMIMSIYLWHMTLLLAIIALCWLAGGIGLEEIPGSANWWLQRPLWLAGLTLLLLPVAQLFSVLERGGKSRDVAIASNLRLITGTLCAAAGIGMAAMFGYTGNLGSWVFIVSLLLAIGGAALCGVRLKRG